MLTIQIEFEQLLAAIDNLSSEQQGIIRQHLNMAWSKQLKQTLNELHSKVPTNISEDEIQADIEFAIRKVRSGKN